MSDRPTVLITGCSNGGLGPALATEFHGKGYRVFATARDMSKMTDIPSEVEKLHLDVTSDDSIGECVAEIKSRTGGKLNLLINNAGVWHTMPMTDMDLKAARKTFDINFWAVLDVTQAFLPLILAAQAQSEKTTIVLAGSLAGANPTPFSGIYGASKAAAEYVYDVLRMELAPWNVNVVILKTGAVKSLMAKNQLERGLQKPHLPPDSLYNIAKDQIEQFMNGKNVDVKITAAEWAKMVVKELDKMTPPTNIWGGEFAFTGWLMQFLPTSFVKGLLDRVTGLGAVTQGLKEQRLQLNK